MLLFSDMGMKRLDEIVHPGLLCIFDFDGTLTPIVPQPDQAWLPSRVRELLVELSRYADIAILTGRSLQDIKSRLQFEPRFLLGNHGIEGLPDWEKRCQSYRELCNQWQALILAALQDTEQFDPAIWIENKEYSLSVHYRQARDTELTAKRLSELFQHLSPNARIIVGKCVFNLLPIDAEDKGSALKALLKISGAKAAIYVGDDATDEDAFKVKKPELLTVRIGHLPASAAEFYLLSAEDISRLLEELLRRLKGNDRNLKTGAYGRKGE